MMIRPPMQPDEEEVAVSNDWDGEGGGDGLATSANGSYLMMWAGHEEGQNEQQRS